MLTATEWLEEIYQGVEAGHVVIWRNDTCGSAYLPVDDFSRVDAEVRKCKETPGANIYFGLGVQPEKIKGRGSEKTVSVVTCVWVDLDYAEKAKPGGNQKNYPPEAVVQQALKDMPVKASVIIKTGGGVHAYWLLDEPFIIETDEDRARFRKLTWGWQGLIKRTLSRLHPDIKKHPSSSYDVDSTGDLARVLRLPGGWMHSYEAVVVAAEGYGKPESWSRYSVDDLEEFSVEVSIPTQKELISVGIKVGNLVLSPTAQPDTDKFALLMDQNDNFKRVWHHQKIFESNSETEMSLCMHAINANWPHQEIANLIIAHRRKWEPQKMEKVCKHPSYISGTIRKCSDTANLSDSVKALNGVPEENEVSGSGEDEKQSAPTQSERDKTIAHLSNVFGVQILGVIQFGRRDPLISIQLANGEEFEIGGANDLMKNCTAVRNGLFSACDIVMNSYKKEQWIGIVRAVNDVKVVSNPEDYQDSQIVLNSAESYLQDSDLYPESAKVAACAKAAPVVIGGMVHINIVEFRKWQKIEGVDRWEPKRLLNSMRLAGFAYKSINYRHPDTKVSARCKYWLIEAGKLGVGVRVPPGSSLSDSKTEDDFNFGNNLRTTYPE